MTKLSQRETQRGSTYGSLYSIKSAISIIQGRELEDKANFKRFFKAIHRMKPPKQMYDKIWNIDTIFLKMGELFSLDQYFKERSRMV